VYADYSPFPDFPRHSNHKGEKVVVLEGGEKAKDVIAFARREELTSIDFDGNEIFWIVFSDDPRRVWDCTGRALRQTIWHRNHPNGRR
jgi:hypothetical protein